VSPEDDQPPTGIDRGLELAFGDKQPKTKIQGDDEGLRSVELSPFLLARHEVTKGQWTRIWVDAAELQPCEDLGTARSRSAHRQWLRDHGHPLVDGD
jgi:formylglycine-generating enzyme required for sulfatase activity